MSRLKTMAASEETASLEVVLVQTKDTALLTSYRLRSGLALGIVFLMTAKPQLLPALVALGVRCAIGLLVVRGIGKISDRTGKQCDEWSRAVDPTAPQRG